MSAAFKRTLIAAAFAAFLPLAVLATDSYRWIDPEDGETIYSPTPPTDPDLPYARLRDGVVIEQYSGSELIARPESEFDAARRAAEAQRKADALLMVQFKNCDAIRTAMEAELDNLGYDFNLVDGTYTSLRKSLMEQIGVAANRQRAGLPVAAHEREKFESIRARLAENRTSRRELDEREQKIRSEYDAKRARYQHLLQQRNPPSDC